ncbi:dihydroxyacetone kinase family protein [Kribbella solani]|uniref:Dihydroxyacetone kinase n=1 Tax=Kribbella solani TaxID=236067 RepID=A0A841DKT9_9ACTN|nr:dihydroxyacetone kinase family protein [Kribbella solani]MBB5977396.1 dihydroxyacetone kinase [Kribbella solani]
MTAIHNGAETFADEALQGLVLAYGRDVRRVDGGVIRAAVRPAGQVGVVLGGGSGHYPAFAGLVGPGLATGAVCGQVFTSPSAAQAYRVCHAVDAGAGVLLVYGNYAGDVLHFGIAQRRLLAEGHDVRTVLVTDDIASAPIEERDRRRGIAGDFVVVKIAGAAAEAGADLDAVERVARKANRHTRTLGIAISGCTLPGATEPLFEVAAGTMSVGLGIHGEAGIEDRPLAPSSELAVLLVDALLAERVDGGGPARVALVVNGLGTVKYEELFVLFKDVAGILAERGVEVVEPEVGELVTSLDMGGVSVTVCWLDDELETLWRAPARGPAFAKTVPGEVDDSVPDVGQWSDATVRLPRPSTAELVAAANDVVAGLELVCATLAEHEEALARLDAVAGDGDHGSGMVRGARAALAAGIAAEHQGADAVLVAAGRAWAEYGAGTSGALWGAGLEAAGLAANTAGTLNTSTGVQAVGAAVAAIEELGGARPGDKTMLDAMHPFITTLTTSSTTESDRPAAEPAGGLGGESVRPAVWVEAAAAAGVAAAATAGLKPRVGRARPLAEKSFGHPDPGATSFAIVAMAVAQHLMERSLQ